MAMLKPLKSLKSLKALKTFHSWKRFERFERAEPSAARRSDRTVLIRGFTPSLKFRQPQSVPSGTDEHAVLESNVFAPASRGRQKNQSKFSAGFTLIEMAVATGIFSVLVISAVSIMISVTKAQVKIQRVQTAIDNVRFSMELITKEMRVGTGYEYYSDCDPSGPAQSGIRFTTSTGGKRIYYLDSINDRIMRSKTSLCADAVPFTAEDVRVDRFRILLRGIPGGSSDGQPWATFNMAVTVLDPKGVSDFSMDLQTSVVQRIRDFP